ncbi:hypothetical protein LCGC14_2969610 [marine sediment metagenome]|uniref:Uncharacterized protein n=1 Tax=marine sediment metagenome TaxID=412755 RepID=A0A0F8ZHK9_9ZZZZ
MMADKQPPIIIVPDKSYIDDKGNVIPTDVILITDINMYYRMYRVLEAWGKEEIGIPGQRGTIEE